MEWKKKATRFILFVDILGFKDLVMRENHAQIIKKLTELTHALEYLEGEEGTNFLSKYVNNLEIDQTKSVTFSDSIIVFSKGCTATDAAKIIANASALLGYAMMHKIPVKGAISYGQITIDFEKSLFFGRPLIDAYLLHEELNMLSIIIDHNAEKRFNRLKSNIYNYSQLVQYEVSMKYSRVTHTILAPTTNTVQKRIENLKRLYFQTSGKPRIYIDTTLKFYESLLKTKKAKTKAVLTKRVKE